ncbi:MAG: ATP-binding protein [Synergistaceae bacterium]|nr:ATP-binding protein [Synergistaceae bacterium]
MCFEGANASGKTCALRVLAFIYDFCLNSFSHAPDDTIPYDTFFHNEDKSGFYISFCIGTDTESEYTYEAELDRKKIYSERLTLRCNKDKTVLLLRRKNKLITNNLFSDTVNIIYRERASVISTLLQYGVKEINPVADFFRKVNSNVVYSSTLDYPMTDHTAHFYHEHPDIHQRVIQQLRAWDTGIKNVEIIKASDVQGHDVYMSVFLHDTDAAQERLSFSSQSNGTKLLYNRLKDIFIALDTGGVLIFDELDTHLHFEIIPSLLSFFTDTRNNKLGAQIIFTSHSTALLDDLKKYRVYLFKKLHGESICYRIDEVPNNALHRNDRSLEQLYKLGVLGGLLDVSEAE